MSKHPELTQIKSSMFTAHHYDPATRQMTVQFKNGSVYVYDDVPMERHEAFAGNQSPGRFFNERIKSQYPGRNVSE